MTFRRRLFHRDVSSSMGRFEIHTGGLASIHRHFQRVLSTPGSLPPRGGNMKTTRVVRGNSREGFVRTSCILESLEVRSLMSANLVADFGGIYPTDSVEVNGVAYFSATDQTHGQALWRSDGTAAGTQFVVDLPNYDYQTSLYAVNGKLEIVTRDLNHEGTWQLYSSDGTATGTHELAEFNNNNLGEFVATVVNDRLVFLIQSGFDTG